jgi:hypothetical protein
MDTHDQYADEQLQNMQKRIYLIEFLRYVLLLFIKEDNRPDQIKWKNTTLMWYFFIKPFKRGERMGQSVRRGHAPHENLFSWNMDTHDQYADEQLQNMQKRIYLIEFLRYVLLLFIKGDNRPDQI